MQESDHTAIQTGFDRWVEDPVEASSVVPI
jgi:hypothetical protein